MAVSSLRIYFLSLALLHLTGCGYCIQGVNCTIKENLPCIKYVLKGSDCSPFRLMEYFPALYDTNGTAWPSMATNFEFSSFFKKHPDGPTYPGVNLTFSPPKDSGIWFVKGFEIFRYKPNQSPACYIFDLSNATWAFPDDIVTVFEHEVYLMQPNVLHRFELYSLPKPPAQHDQFSELEFTPSVSQKTEEEVIAANWVFNISVDNRSDVSEIYTSFNSPPVQYGFDVYDVRLYDETTRQRSSENLISDTRFTFRNVSPGSYRVTVQPYDVHFNDQRQCLCKIHDVCVPCTTTKSNSFLMHEPRIPTQETTIRSTTIRSTTFSTTDDVVTFLPFINAPSDSGLRIGLAVLGSVLGLAIACVAMCILWKKRKRKYESHQHDQPDDGQPALDGESFVTVDVVNAGLRGTVNNVFVEKVSLARKKVFIIYEEDHPSHCKVVEMFGKYLQQCCHCDVWLAAWHLEASWLHQELQQADTVILVNSQAAFNVFKSGKKAVCGGQDTSLCTESCKQGLPGINSLLMKLLQNSRPAHKDMITVHFDYTAESYILSDLSSSFTYSMMKHYTELLCHIHGLKRTDDLNKYDLPLDGKHFRLPAGQELLTAIKEAERFERDNPKWFVQNFRMFRSISNASEESKIDSGIESDPQLQEYLEGLSVGVYTIQPPFSLPDGCYSNPAMTDDMPCVDERVDGPAPRCTYRPDNIEEEFDFYPPDDESTVSRTLSDQLMSINKLRLGHKNYQHREEDLHILEMQSRASLNEVGIEGYGGDTYSVGGDSV